MIQCLSIELMSESEVLRRYYYLTQTFKFNCISNFIFIIVILFNNFKFIKRINYYYLFKYYKIKIVSKKVIG
jgi:hypothetical protein